VSASPEPACARSAGPTAGVHDIPEAFAFTNTDRRFSRSDSLAMLTANRRGVTWRRGWEIGAGACYGDAADRPRSREQGSAPQGVLAPEFWWPPAAGELDRISR